MAFPALTRYCCRLAAKTAVVAALVLASSYCTDRDNQAENAPLSSDEAYLIDAFARIEEARGIRGVNHEKSESLFAALDSTIDRDRVSNTIRELNADPDRWLTVYRGVEQALEKRAGAQPHDAPPPGEER